MKKGFAIDQLMLYILALFISGLILFYGYRAIKGIQCRAEEISLVRFEENLRAKIETLSSQYDSVRIEELDVPLGSCLPAVEKVCFADETKAIQPSGKDGAGLCKLTGANYDAHDSPAICNALQDKTDNVFLLPGIRPLRVKKIKLGEGTVCISAHGGRVSLKLTGKGDGTQIEPKPTRIST